VATRKTSVLALPDVGLTEEQVQRFKKEFENQILGILVKAGAPVDTQIENVVVVVR
jgi:hypothetical protein